MSRTNLSKRKTKGLMWAVCGLLFLCFAILTITSCEENSLEWLADDSSYEARLEEARIAIDDRDYQTAIELLEQLKAEYPGDPLILQYLSNAYAGRAGLDTYNFLTTIDKLIEEGNTGSINMVGTVLGDVTGTFTEDEITNALNNLNLAIAALEEIGTQNLTDDQKVQLGFLSMNRAAMTIADIVADDTGASQVTLTEEGLASTYPTSPDFSAEYDDDRQQSLSTDMERMDDAVDETELGSDLDESFNEFMEDIDPDGDEDVSLQELENFIDIL